MEEHQTADAGGEKDARPTRRNLIKLIAVGIVVLFAAGVLLFWMLRGRQTGSPVPAPRSVSFDEPSATGAPALGEQTLALAPEQLANSDLKIEVVGETLASAATVAASTGVVQANAYQETPVVSLVGGVARAVNAGLGQSVVKGQAIATIYSDELAASQSRYLALRTEAATARSNYERAARLLRLNPTSRAELDAAEARLRAKRAELDEMQRRYARTAKLLEIGAASRQELEQDRTKLRTAEADLEQSQSQFRRSTELAQIAPESNAEIEQASVRLKTAEADLAAARQRLIVLGVSPSGIERLRSPSQITATLALTAPLTGIITARTINAGEVVEANKELFRVTNLSSVWVIAQAFEGDLARLRVGSGASVTSQAFPDRLFRGTVTYIDPNINAETRTAQVRVELPNPDRILRLGMYVNVAFGSLQQAEQTVPVVSASAVQTIGSRQVVFVPAESSGTFIVKTVRLGTENEGKFAVLEGLNVGDRVVTSGSFLLRAEWAKQNPAG